MKLSVTLFIRPPLFDAELFQLGIRDSFALLDFPSQHMIGYPLLFQRALIYPEFLIQLFAAAREGLPQLLPSAARLNLALACALGLLLEAGEPLFQAGSSFRHL